ncbi:uncharacterized protein LOC105446582 [Strongylocentrotus purpuratus]|uniref:Profilin n=1 Tax=Strongylocentrotus purpuratus TaxID=7668 RepID=A0A7M7LTZ2_STRPU|nr:uncharacterized protein LOC105446582 [Strongylocentrotus purpuratus]|eukprot:XP_011681884.1 PREDICTED: uncharacterized protein LOC105446582 isoform X1 [Strongylocentrotus purpuratus]
MMDQSRYWEDFVNEKLVQGGAVTGICLVSHQGVCLYSMGLLKDFEKTCDVKQILHLFNDSRKQKTSLLSVYVTGQGSLSFQVHQQTNCSLIATSAGSHIGLLMGNLPHGILACTYTHREPEIGRAKKQFEEVCRLLRS